MASDDATSDQWLLDHLSESNAAEGGPNMDIDDINVSTDPPPLVPSELVLTDLLRPAAPTVTGWTHIVRRPGNFRCRITDPQAAGELYRSVWRYASSGMCVLRAPTRPGGGWVADSMERRLSPVPGIVRTERSRRMTRCSLSLQLAPGHLLPSADSEIQYLQRVVGQVVETLRVRNGVVSYTTP